MGLLVAVMSVGCTSVREVATINGVKVHRITARSAFAPNVTTLVTSDPNNPGHIDFAVQASGPSIANSVISAAGGVGSAVMLGHSMKPDRTTVNNSAQGGGGGFAEGGYSDSTAQGGSSFASGGTATGGQGGAGGAGGSGQGYGSAGATSSSASQSGSYSQSDSWSGVIGSGNVQNKVSTVNAPQNNNGGKHHKH